MNYIILSLLQHTYFCSAAFQMVEQSEWTLVEISNLYIPEWCPCFKTHGIIPIIKKSGKVVYGDVWLEQEISSCPDVIGWHLSL